MDSLRLRLQFFFIVLAAVMILGTAGFMILEDLSFSDAVYFSVVTVATVGYGDIAPATDAGRILAVILIILGVGTFLGVIANSTELLLNRREKRMREEKVNMIIGVFFSEIGTQLLKCFSRCDPHLGMLSERLVVSQSWDGGRYQTARALLESYSFEIRVAGPDLQDIFDLLTARGELLLRLFENPYLLEHQSITDLLRAVLHLKEELLHRPQFDALPSEDLKHLSGDIRRVYILLAGQWLSYLMYLQGNYPYLFSLAARLNPFKPDASAVVRDA